MLNVNVQTVALVAQQSALAHLFTVEHKQRYLATEWAKAAKVRRDRTSLKLMGFRA
jgi:hypothetical protein